MAIWHERYTRKLSPIERASLVLNEFCNYNCDIIVEGHGALSVDTLRSAVEKAAQDNPLFADQIRADPTTLLTYPHRSSGLLLALGTLLG